MGNGGLRKVFPLFLLLVFLSGFLFFLDKKGWIAPVRGVIERPIILIEERIHALNISISSYLNIFSYWREGEKEIMRLQGQLRQTAVESSQLSACLEENEKMRALLGVPLPPDWKFLPAKVIGVTDKMRLDKGEKDGVKQGMMVVSENILVGRVDSVEAHFCLVTLPITPNTKIPVVVRADKGIKARGILVSQPGQKLILDKVLQQEDIQPGDLVVTSADWLPDLVIGQIEEVLAKPVAIYKKARVSPLVDYHGLRIVFIVIKS